MAANGGAAPTAVTNLPNLNVEIKELAGVAQQQLADSSNGLASVADLFTPAPNAATGAPPPYTDATVLVDAAGTGKEGPLHSKLW